VQGYASDRSTARGLLDSEEPCVRYRILVGAMGRDPEGREAAIARDEVRESVRVKVLLAERDDEGRIPLFPYAKWRGAHWVLAVLADLGYPPGDPALAPLAEQVYGWLLSPQHEKDIRGRTRAGRVHWHAAIEGNALYYLQALGLADERTGILAQRLLAWQWPDGGWNCDLSAAGHTSSFTESLLPLRGMALFARRSGSPEARQAVSRAAEVFLSRRLYRRRRDGEVIRSDFAVLHYPWYWHYDVLAGLKVMSEAGYLGDERCADALDLLAGKRLPEGGFPAEGRYYRVGRTDRAQGISGDSLVDWGGAGRRKPNPFVTAEALAVLAAAGRLA
jgi:hypothetical protein